MSKTSIDKIYMGSEPIPSGPVYHEKDFRLAKIFSWYNYFYTVKEGREWIARWMKSNNYTPAKIAAFNKAPDNKISMTNCILAKMLLNGAELNKNLLGRIHSNIDACVSVSKKPTKKKQVEVVVNVNERVREKCSEVLANIEHELDVFYANGYQHEFSVYDLLKINDIKPSMAKHFKGVYEPLVAEIETVIAKKDKDLVEGYARLQKKQLTSYLKFVKMIVSDIERYFTNKVVAAKPRKPRKKKPIDYNIALKSFTYKKEDNALKIVSFQPVNIFDASSIWIYNTKYKKLTVLYAETDKKLAVRGTTIVNVDMQKSKCKTVKKPDVELKKLLESSKPALNKFMANLTTKESAVTGRVNNETILLRCVK